MNGIVKPIIVVGAPRSGTSILARILSCHPALAFSNEPRFVWRYGNDHRSDVLAPEHLTPKVRRHINNYFSSLLRRSSRDRLLEKHPSNSLRMPFVHAVFPDAQFIHIVRDGYESTSSIRRHWLSHTRGTSFRRENTQESILKQRLKEVHPTQIPYYIAEFFGRILPNKGSRHVVWGPRLPGMQDMVRDLPLIVVCALQWRWSVELACDYGRRVLPSDQYMEIRLEDLTPEMLDRILTFTGLEADPGVATFFREEFLFGRSRSVDLGLVPSELASIRPYVEPAMRELGFCR